MEKVKFIWECEHFTLHQLTDGVFAAIGTERGAGFSNAGLIDLGENTLIFDAFEHPQAAEDLLKASIQFTHRKPTMVVISHWHPDHWGGLQIFESCQILATPATRKAMLPIAREMAMDRQNPSRMEQELQSVKARMATENDQHQRKSLEIAVARLEYDLQAASILKPTLPNQSFDGRIIFHGSAREVELLHLGKGHTESDCILQLPKDRIAFIGDIGFFQAQPFMAYGFPLEWVKQLNDLANGKAGIFVPGHGPVGSKADLQLEIRYIQELENMVQQVIGDGDTLQDALHRTLTPPFDNWQAIGRRFEANVRNSFERLSKQ